MFRLSADDICLVTNSSEDLQRIIDEISDCIKEYGMKVNENKSKVVCVNGELDNRT